MNWLSVPWVNTCASKANKARAPATKPTHNVETAQKTHLELIYEQGVREESEEMS